MAIQTSDDVRHAVRELGIEQLRLQFTDILGIVKNVHLPIKQLDKALEGECMFDGSSIEGFVRVAESDLYLRPDPATFAVFPWKPRTARLICDVYNLDGTPFEGDPRWALKRAVAAAAAMGYEMMAGPEPEFFLFLRDASGKATTETHDQASYFDLAPVDQGEAAREDMVATLQQMGFEIEASHHELAPGQHEIDFKYAPALTTADNIATFRFVVRTVAAAHGLHATFMPKPISGVNGSGLHIHQSLFREGKNAFYDERTPDRLSAVARHYLAGLLRHARGFTAITNPLVNSYKRLVPGYDAPVYVAWAHSELAPMIRVPARRGIGTRLEVRSPDPSCNPYLALAVMLRAGLDGIRNRLEPPPAATRRLDRLTPEEQEELGIYELPRSLGEALAYLRQDEVARDALGEFIWERFLEAKTIEWEVYQSQVHRWEIDQYLATF